MAYQSDCCKALMEIEGVGELTAIAIVATVEDGKIFKNGRVIWSMLVTGEIYRKSVVIQAAA